MALNYKLQSPNVGHSIDLQITVTKCGAWHWPTYPLSQNMGHVSDLQITVTKCVACPWPTFQCHQVAVILLTNISLLLTYILLSPNAYFLNELPCRIKKKLKLHPNNIIRGVRQCPAGMKGYRCSVTPDIFRYVHYRILMIYEPYLEMCFCLGYVHNDAAHTVRLFYWLLLVIH